jgi:iron(III) transport system substrate-binding protein
MRLAAAVTAALLAGGFLAACGGAGGANGSITLYNGQHPQTTQALVSAFEQKTGISVSVRDNDEDVFANQLVAEGSHSPADVIYTENSPPLEFLESKSLLAPVLPATLARVPVRFSSPAARWVGVSARVSVTIYNTDQLRRAQLPTSVLGLADPKWRGKLALAPNETDFQPIVTSVIAAYGVATARRWLLAVKANASGHTYPDNETLVSAVNNGQAALGMTNQYYWYRLRVVDGAAGMHSALAYFRPGDPGYVLDVSGAAVLASSTHQADAQRFVAFLVSPQGQAIIAHSDSFEYPVAIGQGATPVGEIPLSQLQPNPISVGELGDGAAALALLQQVQLL